MDKDPAHRNNPISIRPEGRTALQRGIATFLTVEMLEVAINMGISRAGEASRIRDVLVGIVYECLDIAGPRDLNIMQAILDIITYLETDSNLSSRTIASVLISIRDQTE